MPEMLPPPKKIKYASYSKSSSHKMQGLLTLAIIIAIISIIYIQLDRQIIPALMAHAKIEARSIATTAINTGINEALSAFQPTSSDLISYDYSEDGELMSWNVDSILINQLSTAISDNIMKELRQLESKSFNLPLGLVTGSRFLSTVGPHIKVSAQPIGTVEMNYENDIRAAGINQVNHIVWLEAKTTLQIVVPLSSDQIEISRKIILVDKVIAGDVPSSYVTIPKENTTIALP